MVSVFRSQQRKSQVIKRAPHVYHYICTMKSQLPSYCVDGSASFARYIYRYFCLKYSKLLLNLYQTMIQIIILVAKIQRNTFNIMTCCYRSQYFFNCSTFILTYNTNIKGQWEFLNLTAIRFTMFDHDIYAN